MRQKLITLDPTSMGLAQKKRNFSDWVRKQLRLDDAGLSFEELDAEIDRLAQQKEYWYQKYTSLAKEVGK